MSIERNERVAILLCTFNGERHLSRQLDSILKQDHRDWVIYVSDDGSSDQTLSILRTYQQKVGDRRLIVLQGPRAGYAANFMSLLRAAEVSGDYFAFCDQDDWWEPGKLTKGLTWMRRQPADVPALHCGRTRLIDDRDQSIGYSPLFARQPSFRNALVQSLAGGNTMLLNAAAHQLMLQSPAELPITSHDWWAYLLVTGCGGHVYYDADPMIGYRQHDANLIGSNAGIWSRLDRLKKMLEGNYQGWNDTNLAGLKVFDARLTLESRQVIALFEEARHAGFFKRLRSLARAGLYRQTFPGNLGMVLAVALHRF
jgi:glycosyltransferase involved in cell wall biosynthesis